MRLTGGEMVAEALIAAGVPYVVGIPGHGCLGLVDAIFGRRDRLKVIQVRHEQSAAHLADGYYRACGRPLAVFTSIGPGALNTAVGVATAYVDSSTMLVFTGDVHTHMFGRGVLQEIERVHWANLPRTMEPIVKRWWQVTRVEQLPAVMRQALREATAGRPGPVLVSLPMDVQSDAADVGPGTLSLWGSASGRRGWYGAGNSLAGEQWGGVEEPRGIPSRLDPATVHQAGELVDAARLLVGANRPLILAGGGTVSHRAARPLRELAEYLGIPVITTMMGKGAFPEDHPLSGFVAGSKGTTCGNRLARSADVLLAAGCRFADETCSSFGAGCTFSIPPTKLIHVDIDQREIGKNYPVEVGIVGDAAGTLGAIVEAVKSMCPPKDYRSSDYFRELQRNKAKWFKALARFRESDRVPVTLSRCLKEVREFLDRDAVVVSSSGNSQAQILQEFPFFESKTNLTTGGFSTMGFTLPAAIGAKLALPDRQVIGIVGDGDFMMTVQELATAAQYQVPVVMMVVNNFGWQSIKDLQIAALGADRVFSTEFTGQDGTPIDLNIADIARAFGVNAERVMQPAEVKPALRRAFATGGPSVVEVVVNREPPYSGGLVTGWWDVPIPEYLAERRSAYIRKRNTERLL